MFKKIKFLSALVVAAIPSVAFAQSTATENSYLKLGLALATGLAIGLAVFGGAIAQGKASASALEGVARNPEAANKIMTPLIISLALIESLVIYALIIAFILSGKI